MEILLPSLRIIESFDMRAKIIKIGNSLGIIIPHKILKQLSLKESDELELELIDFGAEEVFEETVVDKDDK